MRQEIDQLFKIFRVLGTPNEAVWPGITGYEDFKDSFPKWLPQDPVQVGPQIYLRTIKGFSVLVSHKYTAENFCQSFQSSQHVPIMCISFTGTSVRHMRPKPQHRLETEARPHPLQVAPSLDPAGQDLLCKMLRYDPRRRVTAKDATLHPYFADIHYLMAQQIILT